HPKVPFYTNMVARAHTRHNQFESALEARADLAGYGPGSQWWENNLDHPSEQSEALRLAENALIGTAIHHHQQAQQLRRRCVEEQNLNLCAQASEQYALAAAAYRGYLNRYPNNPQAYDLQYNLADALYWSESYEDALKEYSAVRDSNLDDSHLSEAARMAVESIKRLVEAAGQQRTVR